MSLFNNDRADDQEPIKSETLADNMLPDGVYFNLNEKAYHALPRLSASGINNMLVSPATFWFESWLNADREDEDTIARVLGRAYHTAILESHRLDDLFVCDLDKKEYGGLVTDSAIKAALKEMGQPQTKAGENVIGRAHRLRACGYEGDIWHLDLEEWENEKGDRTPIPAQDWRDIQTDMQRLQGSPEIADLFTGGAAEVSILWTCPDSGSRMKARVDYLKPEMIVDLKTFQNASGKRLDQCVTDAFRYNRYYTQAALYWTAVELIRSGDLGVIGDATDEEMALLHGIRTNLRPMQSWYVFQEKGGVPNLVAYEIGLFNVHASAYINEAGIDDDAVIQRTRDAVTNRSALMMKAELEIRHAKSEFFKYSEVYGDGEPWQPVTPLRQINDEMFSGFWLDGGL
jgi:hypothetical protein